jgi:hypothetical protein
MAFITQKKKIGKVFPCVKYKNAYRYRPLDIIAAIRATGMDIKPPQNYLSNVSDLQATKLQLSAEVKYLLSEKEKILVSLEKLGVKKELSDVVQSFDLKPADVICSKKQIVENAIPTTSLTGVYFLIDGRILPH